MKKNACKWIVPLLLIALLLTGCLTKAHTDSPIAAPERNLSPVNESGTDPDRTEAPAAEDRSLPQAEDGAPDEEDLEPQPVSGDLTETFAKDDWKRINSFLSNFSEVYFLENGVFYEGMDSEDALNEEYELIRFGYMHLKINDNSRISSDGTYYIVSRADMDNCLDRFLGHTVPAGTKSRTYTGDDYSFTESAEYRNNAYYFPAADGGAFNQLTVVNRVMETARDTFYVEFNVYSLDLEIYFDAGIPDKYYAMSAAEAALNESLTYVYSGIAELKDYQSGSYRSYQLVDYKIFGNTQMTPEPEPAPVESTEEQPEPQPVSDDLTGSFSRDDWKRVNTFLSNFSEVFFVEYDTFSERMDPDETLKDEFEMIRFGYLHLKINDSSKISSDGSHYIVKRSDMDKCLNRFFGHTVPAGTKTRTYAGQYGDITETAEYRNNAYYFEAADGDAYNQFTVVNRFMKTAHGTWYVEFNVYSLDYEVYFDTGLNGKYYEMTAAEALLDENLTYEYSGWAELTDYQSGTYKSYQLVDYAIWRSY